MKRDFYAWVRAQRESIRAGRLTELDTEPLAEVLIAWAQRNTAESERSAISRALAEDVSRAIHELAETIRQRPCQEADLDAIAFILDTLAGDKENALHHGMLVLLSHLLRLQLAPTGAESVNHAAAIKLIRDEMRALLRENPSLQHWLAPQLHELHEAARMSVVMANSSTAALLAKTCPFTLAQVLDPDFWPTPAGYSHRDPGVWH